MAGRRCEGCGKMCSVEVECQNGSELNLDDNCLNIIVELSLMSACCGYEVATASAETDETFEFEHTPPEDAPDDWECSGDLSVSETSVDPTDWYEGKDKNGKPYPVRYQKHFYGAEVVANIECDGCGATLEVSATVGEQAGYFEDAY